MRSGLPLVGEALSYLRIQPNTTARRPRTRKFGPELYFLSVHLGRRVQANHSWIKKGLFIIPRSWYTVDKEVIHLAFWLARILNIAVLLSFAALIYSAFLATKVAWWMMMWILGGFILVWYLFAAQLTVRAMRAAPMSRYPHLAGFMREAEEYARLAGFRKTPRFYVVNHKSVNACAVGHPRNAAVIFTTGTFEHLRGPQLVAVLGHELQHIRQHDSLLLILNMVVAAAIRLATFVIAVIAHAIGILLDLMWGMFGGDAYGRQTRTGRSVYQGIRRAGEWGLGIVNLLLMAALRQAEFRADAAGARLAGYEENSTALGARWMISALEVLHAVNGHIPNDSLVARLNAPHPPLEARVARLNALGKAAMRRKLREQGA